MNHQCDRDGRVTYCYRQESEPAFDPSVFDHEHLSSIGQLIGTADGGRGNTFFIEHGDARLVLRHYRRGGMARYVSDASYLHTGFARSRAFREFKCLSTLEGLALPAARAYACRVIRHGLFYSASLVTYQLAGATLATRLIDGRVDKMDWRNIGECIARFHVAGIYHADLNAHNILVDDAGQVSLIDFDRAQCLDPVVASEPQPWAQRNIERLRRSVCKVAASEERHLEGFTELRAAWLAKWEQGSL